MLHAADERTLRTRLKRFAPRALFVSQLRADAGNRVLLTFDDGPHPGVTPLVLDRLDACGAKALFFVMGRRVRRAPAIVREVVRRGHVIGNHSHLHRRAFIEGGAGFTLASYYRDCARCQTMVERCTGVVPRFFRPPGGRVSPTTLLVPRLLGMQTIGWSIEVADWRFRTDEEAHDGAERLLARIKPLDIVLLHDDNSRVIALLDKLLPGLRERGFDLTGLPRFV